MRGARDAEAPRRLEGDVAPSRRPDRVREGAPR